MNRVLVTALACLFAGPAFAQTPQAPPIPQAQQAPREAPKDAAKPASKAVQDVPERTTASFGDWILRCETSSPPARRICEVAMAMTVQGQTAPIAQIAFGRATRSDPMRLTLVLPPNVTLATKPRILGEKDDKAAIDLTWERCLPGGCVAASNVVDAVVARLSRYAEPGSINFKDAGERDIALPLSFRGLSQALAALGKEP